LARKDSSGKSRFVFVEIDEFDGGDQLYQNIRGWKHPCPLKESRKERARLLPCLKKTRNQRSVLDPGEEKRLCGEKGVKGPVEKTPKKSMKEPTETS